MCKFWEKEKTSSFAFTIFLLLLRERERERESLFESDFCLRFLFHTNLIPFQIFIFWNRNGKQPLLLLRVYYYPSSLSCSDNSDSGSSDSPFFRSITGSYGFGLLDIESSRQWPSADISCVSFFFIYILAILLFL